MAGNGTIGGHHLGRLLGDWHLQRDQQSRLPDYAALAGSLRGLLVDGRLPLGLRLPAERELASALRVSRTTVSAAYRLMRESGHLSSRRGAGSWTTLPAGYRLASSGLWATGDRPETINFAHAALAAPPQLAPAVEVAAGQLSRYTRGTGYHLAGIGELREAVARGYSLRGLPTVAEQVMITNGVQHALDLVLRLLVPPGAGVLVETPTYPNSLVACTARGARVATCSVDPSAGWDEELLLGTLRHSRARLASLIPEFHNPTGHLMPARLRERLATAAHAAGTDLVVDESFVELPLDEPDLPPPVAAFDRHARVLSIGGMSKPYWGGLRLGWVRAAAPVMQRLAAVRVGMDLGSPVLEQLIAVELLARSEEILPAQRALLRTRRDALAAALRETTPQWRFSLPTGGMSLWVELDAPVSSVLARAAEELGVRLAPGPRFGMDGTMERFLRLPFTLPEPELREAVRRLAAARSGLDRGERVPQPAMVVA